ncbi:hypothetical protein BKA59DRAFT_468847 [Fusarium tricinctum]|uniref:Uncharacterized protein n=1 Tax=Fusarium tricinctum TaxID=61284 RepID=A0A8K0S601_9HYPO|nr:hypothetical protein BKA59DRAFT_468847 [Fusarium tricinctum]
MSARIRHIIISCLGSWPWSWLNWPFSALRAVAGKPKTPDPGTVAVLAVAQMPWGPLIRKRNYEYGEGGEGGQGSY